LLVAACGESQGDTYGAATQAAVHLARLAASGAPLTSPEGAPCDGAALTRAAVIALAHLRDPRAMAETARAVSELTDPDDPLAGDACVLWAAAARAAVSRGSLAGPAAGLDLIPAARRTHWTWWITQASQQPPVSFIPNGSVVPLLQAAWSAIVRTPAEDDRPAEGSFACGHLVSALEAAAEVSGPVAASAGALLGARWGASAVPFEWLRTLRAAELVRLGALTVGGGRDDVRGWPSLARRALYPHRVDPAVPHPSDPGVTLGGLGARKANADAVVSLCQIGHADYDGVPAGDHLEFWLVDHPGDNNQPEFVIDQAARAVTALRSEGKRVFLHCHAGLSRTPTVAARYACLVAGTDPGSAFAAVAAATGRATDLVNPELRATVYELAGEAAPQTASESPDWGRSQR
jgi:predicted protein tyrosine phosphatase